MLAVLLHAFFFFLWFFTRAMLSKRWQDVRAADDVYMLPFPSSSTSACTGRAYRHGARGLHLGLGGRTNKA